MSVSQYTALCNTCPCHNIRHSATHVRVTIYGTLQHMSVSQYMALCNTCPCHNTRHSATHVRVTIYGTLQHMSVSQYTALCNTCPCHNVRHYATHMHATHMHNMLHSLICFVDIANFIVIEVCVKQLKQFSRGPQHMESGNFSNLHYNIRYFLQQTRTSNDVSRRTRSEGCFYSSTTDIASNM